MKELRVANRCIVPLLKRMKKSHRIELGSSLHDIFYKIAYIIKYNEKPKRIHRVRKGKVNAISAG